MVFISIFKSHIDDIEMTITITIPHDQMNLNHFYACNFA